MESRFVVKASGPHGSRARWITTPLRNGLRAFGPRDLAALFVSSDCAESAIKEIRISENCAEIAFEVEPIDSSL